MDYFKFVWYTFSLIDKSYYEEIKPLSPDPVNAVNRYRV